MFRKILVTAAIVAAPLMASAATQQGCRVDFLTASASAKVINLATNIAAVAMFALHRHLLYAYALPMGACNVAGALIGARLAILKGNRFVRGLFLAVVVAMIARLVWKEFLR